MNKTDIRLLDDLSVEIIKNQIICDYSAIYRFLTGYLHEKSQYHVMVSLLHFLSMFVIEGHKFLVKYKYITNDIINADQQHLLTKSRANGFKLYEKFTIKTYNDLNNYNNEKYKYFYHLAFPSCPVKQNSQVTNYFVSTCDGLVIANLHLYEKKYLNIDLKIHDENDSNTIKNIGYLISSYISHFLRLTSPECLSYDDIKFDPISITDYDMNITEINNHFSIQNNPPILIALLDVLSPINYYQVIFKINNPNIQLVFKIKYLLMCYSLISIINIIDFCKSNDIYLPFTSKEQDLFSKWKSLYIKNKILRYCKHYDPILVGDTENFEEVIANLSEDVFEKFNMNVDKCIDDFQCILNNRLICLPFT